MMPQAERNRCVVADLDAIAVRLHANVGDADGRHLRRLLLCKRLLLAAGFATAWVSINPISVAAIAAALALQMQIGHHVVHGAYDRVANSPARFHARRFARGYSRLWDWPEWWPTEAWHHVHSRHHAHTGTTRDPDVVAPVQLVRFPLFLRVIVLIVFSFSWKFLFYAPAICVSWRSRSSAPARSIAWLLVHVYLPHILTQFVATALAFFPLGRAAVLNVLLSRCLAELLHNFHSFWCIRSSHAGNDLTLVSRPSQSRADWLVRQVTATANYASGGDVVDCLHMFVNYQVEHHLWPSLPMLQYRLAQPLVRSACRNHGLNYIQGSLLCRSIKTIRIYLGLTKPLGTESELTARPVPDVRPGHHFVGERE